MDRFELAHILLLLTLHWGSIYERKKNKCPIRHTDGDSSSHSRPDGHVLVSADRSGLLVQLVVCTGGPNLLIVSLTFQALNYGNLCGSSIPTN